MLKDKKSDEKKSIHQLLEDVLDGVAVEAGVDQPDFVLQRKFRSGKWLRKFFQHRLDFGDGRRSGQLKIKIQSIHLSFKE